MSVPSPPKAQFLQSTLLPFSLLLTLLFQASSSTASASSIEPDPDPNLGNDYSDQAYYEYASSYQDNNLRMTANADYSQHYVDDYVNADAGSDSDAEQAKGKINQPKKESYSEMASRLNCDNPYFWHAIKCTWLDVKGKNVGERTRRNATTSAWFSTAILSILLTGFCGSCCIYCLKFRKRSELIKLRQRYAPGRMVLPSGKVVSFQPTEEEEKAFEELVKAIAIQEML